MTRWPSHPTRRCPYRTTERWHYPMPEFTSAVIGGLSLGAIYSLVTLGIVLIFRATETFNFAHGVFMLLPALVVGRLQASTDLGFALLAVISLAGIGAL